MSKNFNLFLLHSPSDIHPRSWVCLKGTKIKKIFIELEKNILKNQKWCREKLSREVAKQLNCSHNTIKRALLGERKFYPIPLILELIKLSKNEAKFLKQFKNNIEYLKVNSASAKPIKAVHRLSKNLAKILGAFMADGSLSVQITITSFYLKELKKVKTKLKKLKITHSSGKLPSRNQYYINLRVNKNNFKLLNKLIPSFHLATQLHHNFELTEEYRDNVKAFIRWIKEEFAISPNRFKKIDNAWRVCFSNKILARYLINFFKVNPGPKVYHAFEPKIIKNSDLTTRKAFAKGVLMFDGCVTKQKKIIFSVVSKKLSTSIKEIWKKDKIKFGESVSYTKGSYASKRSRILFILFTTMNNKKRKLLKYFEPNTQKWKLINWLSGELNNAPILKTNSCLSSKKVLKVLQKIERCDAIFLKNHFKCSHSTIRSYLKILKEQKRIKLSNKPKCINNYINKSTMLFLKNKFHKLLFGKIREKFKTDKNFANFLEIHKATMSNWRIKKSRIPIYHLKEMCKALDLDFNEISKNITKTDREIAEII